MNDAVEMSAMSVHRPVGRLPATAHHARDRQHERHRCQQPRLGNEDVHGEDRTRDEPQEHVGAAEMIPPLQAGGRPGSTIETRRFPRHRLDRPLHSRASVPVHPRHRSRERATYAALFAAALVPRVVYLLYARPAVENYQWALADSLLTDGSLSVDGVRTTA